MPAYNAEFYIEEAILSVLGQDMDDWELIVVNDGSTDDTARIIHSFKDPRIRKIDQANKGIGGARNTGLSVVRGQFLVTFDSDDIMPPWSLSSRLAVLQADPTLSFADGAVTVMDKYLLTILRQFVPTFNGEPLHELVRLTGSCFFGPTWMIRLEPDMDLKYDINVSHAEDLLLYISLAKGRRYGWTQEQTLIYRKTGHSSMSNVDGLIRSYDYLYKWMLAHPEIVDPDDAEYFRERTQRIAIGSYWGDHQRTKAILYKLGLRRPQWNKPLKDEFDH